MPPDRQAIPLVPQPADPAPEQALPPHGIKADSFWSRYRGWLLGLVALVLLIACARLARPALHAVKAWQVRRIARQAEQFIDQSNWPGARDKVQDGLALWRQEPTIMHAAARFLTRVNGVREAAAFWKNVEAVQPLTQADERDYASVEFVLGDLDAVEVHLRRAWPAGQEGTPEDWSLAMQLAARRSHPNEAADLAKRLLESKASTERQRFNAAAVLGSSSDARNEVLGWDNLRALAAGGRSVESLEALTILARQSASAAASPSHKVWSPIPLEELITQIERHPQAKVQHQLLALDLRIARDPARRAELVQSAIDRFGTDKDDANLSVLVGWLYGKAEYAQVLQLLPLERAVEDRALFLQHLDTLAALGRWEDVQELIRSQKFPLDELTSQMYQARCAAQLKQLPSRDAHWTAALDAAGTQVDKLMQVGGYAERSGALEVAERAFRAAVQAMPDARETREALIRVLAEEKDTARLRATVAELLALWPKDTALQNDSAYLAALTNDGVPAARDTARRLMREEPSSLPHRVALALAELRLGHPLTALDAFAGVNMAGVQTPAGNLAVYAAVLWETNYEREARDLLRRVPVDQLLPEERALIAPIQNGDAKP